MITRISLQNTATFGNETQTMDKLKKLNFVFGSNGSGKTTISRVLRSPEQYPNCTVEWENGSAFPCKVYNSDFVAENFKDDSDMPGIFTLGKEELETKEKIRELEKQIHELDLERTKKSNTLKGVDGKSGKEAELVAFEKKYTDIFWSRKQRFDSSSLRDGMEGFLNSKTNFQKQLLQQAVSNKELLFSREELSNRAEVAFGEKPMVLPEISLPNFTKFLELSRSPILKRKIVGKEDIDISALIKKLNNSDWVKAGMTYLDRSDGVCPFCQGKIQDNLKEKLDQYFDETYLTNIKKVDEIISQYDVSSSQLLNQLNFILQQNADFMDVETFKASLQLLENVIDNNKQLLLSKKANPSMPVELLEYGNLPEELVNLVRESNCKIQEHNIMVSQLGKEQALLKKQIWRFIVNDASSDIAAYRKGKKKLEDEIAALNTEIREGLAQKRGLEADIKNLQAAWTSVIPTKDLINEWLEEFGFTGFRLEVGSDEHSYGLVRNDGTPVNKTLSEGEKNFVTFLYFYALLKGSQDDSGITSEQVVVIDDPVSSMDSEVLFVVSTLVRDLYESIYYGSSNIRQLFVLSHNLYFYKEVTFNQSLDKKIPKQMNYWTIRKYKGISKINWNNDNPVQSTYEILWHDVKYASDHQDEVSSNSLQNTMRRILEHYYKYYGGISLNKLPDKMNKNHRWIVKTLLAWANDGSHSKFDDICCAPLQQNSVSLYLEAFRLIFEEMGHLAHYNMMMGIPEEK